ncbi:hypothetical protein ACEPAF_6707 [Sanghuangporus sanghuang]
MRAHCSSFLLPAAALLASATLAGVNALPEPNALIDRSLGGSDSVVLYARHDEHVHAMHEPLLDLNETLILQWHKPTPPSYGTHDLEDQDVTHKYPHLMALHAVFMCLAFFGALPIGIALRSVNHGLHGVTVAAFYGLIVLGLSCSGLYRKLTPNMYENAKHAPQGYFVLFFAVVLTTIDVFAGITRAFRYALAVRRGDIPLSVKGFWKSVVLKREDDLMGNGFKRYGHEYTGLVAEPEELEMDAHELKAAGNVEHVDLEHDPGLSSPTSEESTSRWVNEAHGQHTIFRTHPTRRDSRHSDETLHELPPHVPKVKPPMVQRIGSAAFATAERALVIMGYAQVITGMVSYTGICRDSYINGCLAHLIKGGIFWCYGLFTFARFLGSFSELGWAWNRSPRMEHIPTAEFVESFLIFTYGITNTWMERFGAQPGDPFSTKQIQHISIAVMFWFAGLIGMGIESKTIRNWLATPSANLATENDKDLTLPASYRASFNPFPALVIGVTGLAMAAHAQVYLFQVQIHILWGQLLAGAALLRCLTYFFLWLSPPSSVLPSRPPTEALASFFLACGGLMFQLSTEEINLAAMRRGHDDKMMFLNFAVAVTCFVFCWVLAVVTFKAWLKVREGKKSELRSAPAVTA